MLLFLQYRENIYVKTVKFNGTELKDYRIKASELVKGGTVQFEMSKYH